MQYKKLKSYNKFYDKLNYGMKTINRWETSWKFVYRKLFFLRSIVHKKCKESKFIDKTTNKQDLSLSKYIVASESLKLVYLTSLVPLLKVIVGQ